MRQRHPRAGYTLMELVVVVVLLGILAGFLATCLDAASRAYLDLRSRSANVSDAHQAFELMSRDIQEIRTATSADIPTFTSSALTFTDISGTRVAYSFSGSTLTRDGQTLLDRLQSLSFAYLQQDGTTAVAATDIWTVEVSAILERSGRTLTLRTRLFPRNATAKLASWKKT